MSEKAKVGIQLYTVRDELDRNFVGTIETVKKMGYEGVEFAGNYGGYSAADLKKLCAEIGLDIISTHCSYENFEKDFEGTLQYHADLGLKYLAIPWMPAEKCPGKPGFDTISGLFRNMQKALAEKDIRLLYHNHDFEFVPHPDGGLAYDRLIESIPGMWPEFDVCWVTYSGNDPVGYIKKYAGKVPVVHLKDFTGRNSADPAYALIDADGNAVGGGEKKAENTFRFQPVGSGCVKMEKVVEAALSVGTKAFIVEQDDCYGDCFGAAEKSRAYLRSLGL
ncbi:MAG: sugar phosphate isomerase/epimerase family protein [Eubacteriales bacterium]